jgi:two-component system, NtrC family, response regulator AtoC
MGNLLPQGDDTEEAGIAAAPSRDLVEPTSPSMCAVEGVIRELAPIEIPVLLLGESGAGKRTTAWRIHQMSRQWAQPFRSLLCSTLKPEDLEGASGTGTGLLSEGTVYLQEVGDLSLESQERLLQVLQRPSANPSQVRLICGSTRDLEPDVKAGRIREDFYYRISGVCLRLPPLRQRREDILGLLDYFLRKYSDDFHRALPNLSDETRELFHEYSWPGNLRELEAAAKVLVVLGDHKIAMTGLRVLQSKSDGAGGSSIVSLKAASKAASRAAEKQLILKTLGQTRWNRRRAAQALQISYKALLYKLKQIRCEGYGAS